MWNQRLSGGVAGEGNRGQEAWVILGRDLNMFLERPVGILEEVQQAWLSVTLETSLLAWTRSLIEGGRARWIQEQFWNGGLNLAAQGIWDGGGGTLKDPHLCSTRYTDRIGLGCSLDLGILKSFTGDSHMPTSLRTTDLRGAIVDGWRLVKWVRLGQE